MLRKRILKFALIIPALAGLCVMASTPNFSNQKAKKNEAILIEAGSGKIIVDKSIHDFGTIKKDAGAVSAVFKLTNKTKSPIIISDVKPSCGCTTPDWTKSPIEPKKTGQVTATYSPSGSGPFEKTVTVYVSEGDKTETLVVRIKGTVE